MPLLPASLLQKYIRIKRIKINGRAASRETRLLEGDIVQLYINDEFFDAPSEENSYLKISTPKLSVLYEDENILLLDKAPGILCHSAGKWDYSTLISNVQAYLYQKGEWEPKAENSFTPALCNRIDRNTGGIVIAAKNAPSLRAMNEKIKSREIEKYYLCIVTGSPKPAAGVLSGYIFKDAVKNRVYVRRTPEKGARGATPTGRLFTMNGFRRRMRAATAATSIRAQSLDGRSGRSSEERKYGSVRPKATGETGRRFTRKHQICLQKPASPLDY